MKKIFLLDPDNTACGYYRSKLPHRHCASILAKEGIELDLSNQLDWSKNYDAYIFHRFIAPQFIPYLHQLKAERKKIVWELDDDLFNIPTWSGAHGVFRQEDLEALRLCLAWSDEIIVSTEHLKTQLGYEDKSSVLPNLVDLDDWKRTKFNESDEQIRILWAGSNTHQADIQMVFPALWRLIQEYGDRIHLVFFGAAPPALLEFPNTTFISNVPLGSYPDLVQLIKPHIALCPLVDHVFNKSKSNIKWLEMTLGGAAVVASGYGPYETIQSQGGGLNASFEGDWSPLLKLLIDEPELRRKSWIQAMECIEREYSWQAEASREIWLDYFRKVVE